MSSNIYIFAGGGTGGHLYPALAVAERLEALQAGARVVFACSNRPIDREVLAPGGRPMVVQPVRPLPRRPGQVPGFLLAWMRSARLARDMVRDLKPAAVLGLGGFAAGPLVRQAAKAGVRCALLNPDAVPGRANLYLARYAGAIFTQFEQTSGCFPPSRRAKVHHVGCPVRRGLLNGSRQEAVGTFGLRPDRRTLLVLGGSLGAASVNEALGALREDLEDVGEQWQLLHVTGPARADAPAIGGGRMHVVAVAYCHRMDLAYAAADLALCRAGASTMAELAATGTPAVLMPYPHHKDRQQFLNAQPFAQAGSGVVCEDACDAAANADRLRRCLLPILGESARLEAMRESARRLARPDAADQVARWLAGAE